MISLRSLLTSKNKKEHLTEGVRLDFIRRQLVALESEWEKLDSQGTGHSRQMEIQREIAKLWQEKEKWEKIYQTINEDKNDGEDIILGGIWSNGKIVTKVGDDISGWDHTREMGANRWRYYQSMGIVFWNQSPDNEDRQTVENWLINRGYQVLSHKQANEYWGIAAQMDRDKKLRSIKEHNRNPI